MSTNILYKYRSADRAVDLRSCTIRLTPPGAFNDPFEALPAVSAAWDPETLKYLEAETHRLAMADGIVLDPGEVRQRFALMNELATSAGSKWVISAANEIFGVVSLSDRYDDALMWGHYADSHRGFVIGFDAHHPWFDRRTRDDDPINHIIEVNYSDQRPEVYLGQFYSQEDDAKNAAALFLTKYSGWQYESERRLIRRLDEADETTAQGVALLRFPPELVVEVVLGYRMSYADRAGIREILEDPRYKHVSLYEAVLDTKTYHVRRRSANAV